MARGRGDEEEWKGVVSDKDEDGSDDEDESENEDPDPAALQSALSKLGIPLNSIPPNVPGSSLASSWDADSIVPDEEVEGADDQVSWESGSIDIQGNVLRASSSASSVPFVKRAKAKPSLRDQIPFVLSFRLYLWRFGRFRYRRRGCGTGENSELGKCERVCLF